MRRLFIGIVAEIALVSCQAGIHHQIKGKWLTKSENSKVECIEEYLDKYLSSVCKSNGKELYSTVSAYEITNGNLIVFTSDKGVKNIVEVKINGDEMEIQNVARDQWVKSTRIK